MLAFTFCMVLATFGNSDPPPFTAIRAAQLCQAVGITARPEALSNQGVLYHIDQGPAEFRVSGLRLGVFQNTEAAKQAMFRYAVKIPVPADEPTSQPDSDVGDECMQWDSTVVFRRVNALVCISSNGTRNQVRELARRIDAAIRDNREIAPQGEFATPPAIDGFPDRVVKTAAQRTGIPGRSEKLFVPIAQEFRGLGPRENVLFGTQVHDSQGPYVETTAWGESQPKIQTLDANGKAVERDRRPEEDSRFRLILRSSGRHKLTLIAANRENVVVSKTVEIEVADGP